MGRQSSIPGDWNCLFGWQGAEDFYTMALSWRGAADVLLDAWKAAHREGRDYAPWCAYPWVFCWRHAFELLLKSVMRRECQWGEKWLRNRYEKCGHSLGKLWHTAVELVPDLAKTEAEESVRFLDGVDPDGTCMRYPKSKGGLELRNQTEFWVLERSQRLTKASEEVAWWAEDIPGGVFDPAVRGT